MNYPVETPDDLEDFIRKQGSTRCDQHKQIEVYVERFPGEPFLVAAANIDPVSGRLILFVREAE